MTRVNQLPKIYNAKLPSDVKAIWAAMLPIKDGNNHFPDTPYSDEEVQFWGTLVYQTDQKLAHLADNPQNLEEPGLHVHRVKHSHETERVMQPLNILIRKLLNENPSYTYVGFTNGILPNLAELYNDPELSASSQKRMRTALIGGTEGDKIKSTRVLTPIPEWVFQGGIIIAHDDAGDTMGALASFVELAHSKKRLHEYDGAFVDRFTDKNVPEKKRTLDFSQLILEMQEAGVVSAIPFYKNRRFIEMMDEVLKRKPSKKYVEWQTQQQLAFQYHLPFAPEWLMGDGLDTDMPIEKLCTYIRPEVLNHPAVSGLFEHTTKSKLRIGSMIQGIIALQQYPEDTERQYNDLLVWVAKHIEESLQMYSAAYEVNRSDSITVFASPPVNTASTL